MLPSRACLGRLLVKAKVDQNLDAMFVDIGTDTNRGRDPIELLVPQILYAPLFDRT